jgi:hypothetical protein
MRPSPRLTQPLRPGGRRPAAPASPDRPPAARRRGSWPLLAALVLALLAAPPAALAQTVGPPVFVQTLGNGADGEVIAFNPTDGMIYHASGNSVAVFEKIDPQTGTVTPVSPDLGTGEVFGLVWYPPLNVFLATDIDSNLNHITPAGAVTTVGNNGLVIDLRGLALVGARVFATGAFDGNVYEINPANGAILGAVAISLDGGPVSHGHSVTTDPLTGQVYAVLRQGGARKLALLNVTTGAATTLAVLPDNFSSITFVNGELYGVTGDGAAVPETLYRFTVTGRPLANPGVSDQKAGSVLVFPYYTSAADGSFNRADTLLQISNVCNGAAVNPGGTPNYSFLHLFFINGSNCSPADTFVCLTPNGSIQIKASDYDPTVTGYLVAVAVNADGAPVRNNCFIGSAFVRDDNAGIIDSYGAEAFAFINSQVLPVPDEGEGEEEVPPAPQPRPGVILPGPDGLARINLDGVDYDAAPVQFSVQVQDPATADEFIVLASVNGNLGTKLDDTKQSGVGVLYRADETPASFQPQIGSGCLSVTAVDKSKIRIVPGSLDTFLKDS